MNDDNGERKKMMERETRKEERKKRMEKRKKQESEKEIVLNLFPITFSSSKEKIFCSKNKTRERGKKKIGSKEERKRKSEERKSTQT